MFDKETLLLGFHKIGGTLQNLKLQCNSRGCLFHVFMNFLLEEVYEDVEQ